MAVKAETLKAELADVEVAIINANRIHQRYGSFDPVEQAHRLIDGHPTVCDEELPTQEEIRRLVCRKKMLNAALGLVGQ